MSRERKTVCCYPALATEQINYVRRHVLTNTHKQNGYRLPSKSSIQPHAPLPQYPHPYYSVPTRECMIHSYWHRLTNTGQAQAHTSIGIWQVCTKHFLLLPECHAWCQPLYNPYLAPTVAGSNHNWTKHQLARSGPAVNVMGSMSAKFKTIIFHHSFTVNSFLPFLCILSPSYHNLCKINAGQCQQLRQIFNHNKSLSHLYQVFCWVTNPTLYTP